jgi:hypothetical protein
MKTNPGKQMSHQKPDQLQFGESLEIGDFLISADQRFRLYMETGGILRLYGYRTDLGRKAMFERALPSVLGRPTANHAALVLDAFGLYIENLDLPEVPGEPLANVTMVGGPYDPGADMSKYFLVIQSDGNLVVYAGGAPSLIVIWAAATNVAEPAKYIPPNTTIAEVTVGTLVLDTASATNIISNPTAQVSGAKDSSQYVMLPPTNGQVGVTAGDVTIFLSVYAIEQFQGGDANAPLQPRSVGISGEATQAGALPGKTVYSIASF